MAWVPLPRMLTRYGAVTASVVQGFLWGIWHVPLYIKTAFSTFPGSASFIVHTMCLAVLTTVLWANTQGSVFWAIIFHYVQNITLNVIHAMFPVMPAQPGNAVDYTGIDLAMLILLTAGIVLAIGPARLAEQVRAVLAGIKTESIEQDRSPTAAA